MSMFLGVSAPLVPPHHLPPSAARAWLTKREAFYAYSWMYCLNFPFRVMLGYAVGSCAEIQADDDNELAKNVYA
jgi:hypothetical protein